MLVIVGSVFGVWSLFGLVCLAILCLVRWSLDLFGLVFFQICVSVRILHIGCCRQMYSTSFIAQRVERGDDQLRLLAELGAESLSSPRRLRYPKT